MRLELQSHFSQSQICWLQGPASPLPSPLLISTIFLFSLSSLEMTKTTEVEMLSPDAVQEQPWKGLCSQAEAKGTSSGMWELGGWRWVSAGFECPGVVGAVRKTSASMNVTSRALQVPTLPWLTTWSREAHLSWHLP